MKKTVFFFAILFILAACNKDASHQDTQPTTINKDLARQKVTEWMRIFQSTLPENSQRKIEHLRANMVLSEIAVLTLLNTKQVFIIPLKKDFEASLLGAGAQKSLMLILNENGEVIAKNILQHSEEGGHSSEDILKSVYLGIGRTGNDRLVFYTLDLQKEFGWQYENGVLKQYFNVSKKPNAVTGTPNTTMSLNCVEYYWVTYENGVPVNYEYLYTRCIDEEGHLPPGRVVVVR